MLCWGPRVEFLYKDGGGATWGLLRTRPQEAIAKWLQEAMSCPMPSVPEAHASRVPWLNQPPAYAGSRDMLCPGALPSDPPRAELRPSLQMGRLAAQTREQQPQLKSTLLVSPRLERSQADMTLDVIWSNHLIVSDALWSVELGGRHAQSNCPGRLVYIMGVLWQGPLPL